MAEEEKSQKVVETYKAVAAGIASVVAAVFTSKLGVAGTLIGTALTAITITLASALLKVQLMKATNTISGLPSAVQGRFSTQQIRIPGKQNVEPNPEPTAQPEVAKRGKLSGLLSRLKALPAFIKELPSNQRRKVLVAGLLAGVVATVIGLGTVTGIEVASGQTLSCLVWSCPDDSDDSSGSSRSSGLSIFGGYSPVSARNEISPSVDPSGEQPAQPGNQQQPNVQPAQPGGVPQQPTPQGPDETPRGADPARPGAQEPASGGDSGTKSAPSDYRQGNSEGTKAETKA